MQLSTIYAEQILSTGWRGERDGTENYSEEELYQKQEEICDEIFNEIKELPGITKYGFSVNPHILHWESHSVNDPAHLQLRWTLFVTKTGRLTTKNDLYKIINKYLVSYYS